MNIAPANNVSFGMAKFSEEGIRLAHANGATNETKFINAGDLYGENYLLEPPLAKYIKSSIPPIAEVEEENLDEVKDVIISHGASNDAVANNNFIKQLIHPKTQGYIKQLQISQPEAGATILNAERAVFDANWNNPKLTKDRTKSLLNAVKSTMADVEYNKWSGIVGNSDME